VHRDAAARSPLIIDLSLANLMTTLPYVADIPV
jgi:hypothetical protein